MDNLPQHVAIICDGNRRWAKAHNLPESAGHAYAADNVFFSLVEKAARMKIPFITFWVLSTENKSKRSTAEMKVLFHLMKLHFKNDLAKIQEKKVRVKFIGDISGLPKDLQVIISKLEEETCDNRAITALFALNYGGRNEITRAVSKLSNKSDVTDAHIDAALDTAGIPDPEIIIRTGGEHRLSGFLPWQSVYSELFFVDTLFPDFNDVEFQDIIMKFSERERRFGK